MNLLADIGNSSTKIALAHNGKIISSHRFDKLTVGLLNHLLKDTNIEKAIICTVREVPVFFASFLNSAASTVHYLSYKSKLPFKISYKTPESLGSDRIAAIAGALAEAESRTLLVIDAGTAITYDFIIDSEFRGGNISPGLSTRFRSLNAFTARLPLLDTSVSHVSPGKSTEDAIRAGVVEGVVYEINEYIRTFEKKHKKGKVILTGGDGAYLAERISARVVYSPDLVINGLNLILEYNAD